MDQSGEKNEKCVSEKSKGETEGGPKRLFPMEGTQETTQAFRHQSGNKTPRKVLRAGKMSLGTVADRKKDTLEDMALKPGGGRAPSNPRA